MKELCDVNKCLLCYDAPCSKRCPRFKPDRVLRSLRFDNINGASYLLDNCNPCLRCKEPCKKVCPRDVNIKDLMTYVGKYKKTLDLPKRLGIDLCCDICGVKLENPFLLSSSVVSSNYEMCSRALKQGWAGVCFKTISLMDIHEASPRFSALKDNDNTFDGFKNIEQLSDYSLEENLSMLKKLKDKFPNKVLIASIMGRNKEEWQYLAKKITKAGVDVIELNFSCPNMEYKGTGSDVGEDPKAVYKYTKAVRSVTKLPILAKMTPNVTDMRVVARAARRGGANGIAAINTIRSITNVDFDSLVPAPNVNGKSSIGGYSGHAVKPIALRFISDLSNDRYLSDMHISGMGGIYTWKDAVEFLLLGASSLQVTTSVMEYGYRIIDDLILGLKIFMKEKNFKSVKDMVGVSKKLVVNTNKIERDTVLLPKFNSEKCIGCGRCYISCMDGGHQAIKFDCDDRKPILDTSKCVGCHLCKLVCPENAIEVAKKRIDKR